jgi:hypothetical protein
VQNVGVVLVLITIRPPEWPQFVDHHHAYQAGSNIAATTARRRRQGCSGSTQQQLKVAGVGSASLPAVPCRVWYARFSASRVELCGAIR